MDANSVMKRLFWVICITMIFASASYAVTTEEMDASVNAALHRFSQQIKGGRAFQEIAKGVLVIPNITKAAFILGGQYGQGALREDSKTIDYYSMAAGSFGFQIGAEKYDLIIIFATEEALKKFRQGKGWEAGVDAEVTLIDTGLDLPVSTLVSQHPVLGFIIDQKGLMAGASIKGAKFNKIKPD
jgi:lipid-binding SYLF domain-containing protein